MGNGIIYDNAGFVGDGLGDGLGDCLGDGVSVSAPKIDQSWGEELFSPTDSLIGTSVANETITEPAFSVYQPSGVEKILFYTILF